MDNDNKENKKLTLEEELANALTEKAPEQRAETPEKTDEEQPADTTIESKDTPEDTDEKPVETEEKTPSTTKIPGSEFSEEELIAVESMEVKGAHALDIQPTNIGSQPPLGPPPRRKHRQWIIVAILVAIILAGIATAFILSQGQKAPEQSTQEQQSAPIVTNTDEKKSIKLTVATVEGVVSYQAPGSESWQPLTANSTLEQDTTVRTDTDGKTALLFENGTIIRVDSSSSIKIKSLDAADIVIEQLQGTAYSRITPSDNQYSVLVDGVSYVAMGTAFATTNSPAEKGAQVFESTVKANNVAIEEGKQYFTKSTDSSKTNKVTDIDLTALSKDDFIEWNAKEDAKNTQFKDKLGVLSKLEEKKKEAEAKEKQKEKEKAEAKKKQEQEAAKKKQRENESQTKPGTEGTTSLRSGHSTKGTELRWVTADKVNGFKIVYSTTTRTPTFDKDSAIYVSDPAARSHAVSPEKTTWYRVCTYQKDGTCTNYSNAIKVTPSSTTPKKPTN